MTSAPMLQMIDISKRFPGVNALTDVDLEVRAGEIHAIVGENGAGKSTLMRILNGVYSPDAGTIEIEGRPVSISNQVEAKKLGIGMVYQELNLVPDLSVEENISLGRMPSRGSFVERGRVREIAEGSLKALNSTIDPRQVVGALTVSQQQIVEIAKITAAEPRIVVFDEPTSSLSEHEAAALFSIIRGMKQAGIAIIYISHRLQEVLQLADTVTVLRDGHQIATRPADGLTAHNMIELMVGRELSDVFPKINVPIGDVVMQVEGFNSAGTFTDISLSVRAGEVVGLAGLVGAGRTEVARAIFGLDQYSSGEIFIDGNLVRTGNPSRGVKAGIAYVPEDRKRDGIVQHMSIRDNVSLPILKKLGRGGWIIRGKEAEVVTERITETDVQPPIISRHVDTLSGGNQQKVVLAKWLATKPQVLILDEPTRGVDVGAKAEIHHAIGKLAGMGVAILLISSELPEILAACDRIYVLCEGRITAEFDRQQATEQSIMHAATGEVV